MAIAVLCSYIPHKIQTRVQTDLQMIWIVLFSAYPQQAIQFRSRYDVLKSFLIFPVPKNNIFKNNNWIE